MKSFVIRSASLSALALSSVLVGISGAAAQDECEDDSDCAENQHCEFQGESCTGSNRSMQPGEIPPEPECETEGPGMCITDCRDDSDCEDGLRCEKDIAISIGACSPGGECPDPEEEISETGTCRPAPISCESDTDCPSPLVCEPGDCPPSVSGDASQDCANETSGECVFDPKECESDADCDDDYECVVVGAGQECSGTAGASMPDCAPGEECTMPEPEPYEEECETYERRMCFPKEAACDTDDDCEDGWSCLDFSNVPDLESEDGYTGPPWWSTGEPGVAVACMPDGLVAVFEGRADAEGGGSHTESANDGDLAGDLNSSNGEATLVPGPGEDAPSAAQEESTGEKADDQDDDGGCSIASGRNASSSWVLLLGVVLALGLARKRHCR